jgi:hypothetical protein
MLLLARDWVLLYESGFFLFSHTTVITAGVSFVYFQADQRKVLSVFTITHSPTSYRPCSIAGPFD